MARTPKYPRPKARHHQGTWMIYWYWNGDKYTLYPGRQDPNDPDIEADLRQVAVALAMPLPAFPPEWAGATAVTRYMEKRYQLYPEKETAVKTPDEVLAAYEQDLKRHCSHRWATFSMSMVRKMDAYMKGFRKATSVTAREFLADILDKGNKPATRNRNLVICNRFFGWCLEHKQALDNPFAGIKIMREEDAEEITYCTRDERERVLAAAQAIGRADWIAIPIALYSGCRREEVFRLQWEDVNFDTRRFVVRKSKTGKKRTVPIFKSLLAIMEKAKKTRGPVVQPMKGENWSTQADRLVELLREYLCRPETPNLAGRALEAIGKRRFIMRAEPLAKKLAGQAKRMKTLERKLLHADRDSPKARALAEDLASLEQCGPVAHDGGEWMPAERIGWNPFRHTFATLRLQAGNSLDQITDWMGNSHAVCKKHYTEFLPRDFEEGED